MKALDFLKLKLSKFNKKPQNNTEKGFKVDTYCEDVLNVPEEEPPHTLKGDIFEILGILVTSVITVVIIFSLLFRVSEINGNSMLGTLIGANEFNGYVGDRVIMTNLGYEPKNGDIVVISRNVNNSSSEQEAGHEPIVKRVIAVGGQTVNIDFESATVYVDGKALKEDYISSPTKTKYDIDFPVYVPEGHIFVMGDNREDSLDSRSSLIGDKGIIDNRYVLGHVVFRIYPFNRIGRLDNK